MQCFEFTRATSRRDMLRLSACGFGQIALAAMLGDQATAGVATNPDANPTSSQTSHVEKQTHFAAKAKRIIFLFMWGGPSHVDLFDPKPRLNQEDGKALAGSSVGINSKSLGKVLGSPFKFAQHGEGGVWMSELMPNLATQADKMCVLRSVHTEGQAHGEALLRLHTGQANLVRPSVGAWVSYGLGCENQNLPAFVTISPPRGHGGVQNYGNAFLPAIHQGTAIGSAEIPIEKSVVANLKNARIQRDTQRQQLDLIQSLSRQQLKRLQVDQRVEGLIQSYELAYRMQSTMPRIMDFGDETKETLDLYGVDGGLTNNFARQCLLARRMVEMGVRYIQVSTDYTWDHHVDNNKLLKRECGKTDKPIAALIQDLARRGLLEDTLIVWGAEFGRTPVVQNGNGRNHHPPGFTMWMAGGGVKPGFTYGKTDDFGYAPVENAMHMHDVHATLLHALGLDHKKLTYRHAGRDFRLTDVFGKVHDVFA